jgi:hypothetical protein
MSNLPDGVYFGMPEDVYHALPRLSSSGVKAMRESVSDFWEKSWMNPDKQERDDDTAAMLYGRAYHCRLNEGRAALAERYYFDLDPSAFKGRTVYRTISDMKADLEAMGVACASKWKKDDYIRELTKLIPHAVIWDLEVERHAQLNEGRTRIPAAWFSRIERAAAFIEADPELAALFSGGHPEVTILWTKEVMDSDGSGRRYKVPMKARLDYLKFVRGVETEEGKVDFLTNTDLKNFANPLNKHILDAIDSAAGGQKLHIQAGCYYEALDWFVQFCLAGQWFFYKGPDAFEKDYGLPPGFEGLTDKAQQMMCFVFQKSSGAPLAYGNPMRRDLRIVAIGMAEVEAAAEKFAKCTMIFGTEIWIEPTPMMPFNDDRYPLWATKSAGEDSSHD